VAPGGSVSTQPLPLGTRIVRPLSAAGEQVDNLLSGGDKRDGIFYGYMFAALGLDGVDEGQSSGRVGWRLLIFLEPWKRAGAFVFGCTSEVNTKLLS